MTQPAVSKWLYLYLLLDSQDWRLFFQEFSPFNCLITSSLQKKNHFCVPFEDFINAYEEYALLLKKDGCIDLSKFRTIFSISLTKDIDDYEMLEFEDERVLIKPQLPMIQFRPCSWLLSSNDEVKMRNYGGSSVSWGIEIGYPGVFQDPKTKQIKNALTELINGQFYKEIMRWVRKHSTCVTLQSNDIMIKTPLRIGENAKKWMNEYAFHQHLKVKI